jgi:hypothetical protein
MSKSEKKAFFRRRTEAEIGKLDCQVVDSPVGLVQRIEELDPARQALILDFPLVHPAYKNDGDPQYVSRTTMRGVRRHGDERSYPSYIRLTQPRSMKNAVKLFRKGNLPFKLRNKAFFESMKHIPEEENFYVGYMVWPITGDKSPIMVPFWSLAEGCMIDAYSGRVCLGENGSKVERVYGPEVIVKVPSRDKKASKYVVKFSNVPRREMENAERAVVGWDTRPAYGRIVNGEFVQDESASPAHKLTNVSHEGSHRHGESFIFTAIYPHCVAAYQEIIRNAMRDGDYSPMEMSQFAILSREDAAFYNKVRNNLLISETTPAGTNVLKHPRLDQQSMLIARNVANKVRMLEKKGDIQDTMYWDQTRDKAIADYPFLPGEK